ncbi:chitin synthase-domain-containing protein [Leptodontidium sp. 2 PMI_412]|nr:chitin synthase-domain-containing protein [Leptodontidium sp. 2 PMI_412]
MVAPGPVTNPFADVVSSPEEVHLKPGSTIADSEVSTYMENPITHGSQSGSLFDFSTRAGTPDKKSQFDKGSILSEKCGKKYTSRVEEFEDLVTQVEAKPAFQDPDGILERKGKRRMKWWKLGFSSLIFGFNTFLLFGSWWFKGYHYVFLPFIAFGVAVNFSVVVSLVLWKAVRFFIPEKKLPAPDTLESLMLVIPCYNETEDELRNSLDSLVEQKGIEKHRQALFIMVDGRVRGPGMEETTADALLNTILTEKTLSVTIKNAYTGWDNSPMDIILQKGTYKGLSYMCIVKMQNKGKRDGLILLRSFAYMFNLRNENPATILSQRLFGEMASFVLDDCGIDNFHSIVGMDADTIFDPWCIYHLVSELSRYPNCYGVCGVVTVDFKDGDWNLWRLMQNAAYTISQGLPRLHQSTVTHKVSCLPGCCQILKVCEENNGDYTLRELFGYCPSPNDSMLKHLRGSYSEDRNHVCHVLTSRPHVQTRQAIKAIAWTDVPTSLSVFMSQRKRWSMGATVNDLHLFTSRGTQWFERIRSFSNIQTWFCNIFIMGSIAGLIHAATSVPWYVTVGFLGGVIIPYIYMVTLVFWMPPTPKAKAQFLLGLVIYFFTGPFLTIAIQFYTTYHLDSFSWGKTRRVVSEDNDNGSNSLEDEKASTLNDDESTVGLARTT